MQSARRWRCAGCRRRRGPQSDRSSLYAAFRPGVRVAPHPGRAVAGRPGRGGLHGVVRKALVDRVMPVTVDGEAHRALDDRFMPHSRRAFALGRIPAGRSRGAPGVEGSTALCARRSSIALCRLPSTERPTERSTIALRRSPSTERPTERSMIALCRIPAAGRSLWAASRPGGRGAPWAWRAPRSCAQGARRSRCAGYRRRRGPQSARRSLCAGHRRRRGLQSDR